TLRTFYEKVMASRAGLEGFVEAPTKEDMVSLFKTFWQNEGYESKVHEKKRYEYGLRAVERYFDQLHTGNENPLFLEKAFKYAIDDCKVVGKIDRVDLLRVEDGVRVVEIIDYK